MEISPIKKEVTIGDCRLILGDCLAVMPTLGKVDACVCDPPYGLGKKLQGGTWGKAFKGVYEEWDTRAPQEIIDYIIRLKVPTILWGGNYFTLPLSRKWLVWNKPRRRMTMADGELAWCSWDGNLRTCDVWNVNGTYVRQHPTQKPVGLMRWCIEQLPKEVVTILDPFMGSGTTLVACAKMGRKGVGIELDPDYFEIACKRVEDAYKQPDMFVEQPTAKATQQDLILD